MPNHFHLMVYVNEVELPGSGSTTLSRTPTNLNKSIGILLASYTRAINKQNNTSGSLFRAKTKAECLDFNNRITPSFLVNQGVTIINIGNPEKDYPQTCFNYIHANPTKAGLVNNDEDWEFSSASDYAGLRVGTLIAKEFALKKLELK